MTADEIIGRPAPSFAEVIKGHEDAYALICLLDELHPEWTSRERIQEVLRLQFQQKEGTN